MIRTVKDAPICQQPTDGRAVYWITGLLILATAAAYTPIFWQEFINYDDPGYITDNPHIQNGLNLQSVRWAFTSSKQSNWHPLTWISLILDYQMFSGKAWGFKLVNLILHIANTVLLFWIMKRMTRALWSSAFIAALFALHPLHVESVAWIAERKDVLSSFFWMLTMWVYVSYAQKPSVGRYIAMLLSFAVGLLAKPMLVTLPFVLLLMDGWPLNRFSKKALPTLVAEKIPLLILTLISCVITFIVQQRGGAVSSLEIYSLSVRLQNAAIAYVSYLGKMFVPIRLAVFYPHPGETVSTLWAMICVAVLIGITLVVLKQRSRRPYLLIGWLWYLGTLVPVIGLVQVGGQAMADRYTYIPLIGIFIMIAEWGHEIRSLRLRRTVAVAVLIVLAGITVRQVGFWKDSITLNSHAVAVTKNNHIAHSNLGIAWNLKDQYSLAIQQLIITLKICPESADDHYNIAYSYAKLGQNDKALFHYDQAIRFNPANPLFYSKKGQTLARIGRHDQACLEYRRAIHLDPENAALHHDLGLSLARSNQPDDAVKHLQLALQYQTGKTPEYQTDLGNAYLMMDDYPSAVQYYQKALTTDPDYYSAHLNLTIALLLAGQPERSLQIAEQYVRNHPNDPDALYALGNTLLRIGQVEQARKTFEQALHINPDHPQTRQALSQFK